AIELARSAAETSAGGGADATAAALLELAERLAERQREADLRIAEIGVELVEPGDRVLTHCNTGPLATGGAGTAGGVIAAASDAPSRPMALQPRTSRSTSRRRSSLRRS